MQLSIQYILISKNFLLGKRKNYQKRTEGKKKKIETRHKIKKIKINNSCIAALKQLWTEVFRCGRQNIFLEINQTPQEHLQKILKVTNTTSFNKRKVIFIFMRSIFKNVQKNLDFSEKLVSYERKKKEKLAINVNILVMISF